MHRIDQTGSTPDNRFTMGDAATKTPGTVLGADWPNAVQEELVKVVLDSGLVLNKADNTQLLAALRRHFGGHATRVSASATLTLDHSGLVLVDASAAPVNLTLPAVTALSAAAYVFVRVDAATNTVSINRAGTDNIGGAANVPLRLGEMLSLVSDGASTWSPMRHGQLDAVGQLPIGQQAAGWRRYYLHNDTGPASPALPNGMPKSPNLNYTPQAGETGLYYVETTQAGGITFNLPAAASVPNGALFQLAVDAYFPGSSLTLAKANAADTLHDDTDTMAATVALAGYHQALCVSDGVGNWNISLLVRHRSQGVAGGFAGLDANALVPAAQGGVPVGTILDSVAPLAPAGYLKCFGQPVNRATYGALFAALTIPTTGDTTLNSPTVTVASAADMDAGMFIEGPGIPFNTTITAIAGNQLTLSANATAAGTGVALRVSPFGLDAAGNTFNLPDLRGRVTAGKANQGGTHALLSGTRGDQLGSAAGEETHILASAEMPAHSHAATSGNDSPDHTHNVPQSGNQSGGATIPYAYSGNTTTGWVVSAGASARHTHAITVNNAGGGAAHENMQPTLFTHKIIKY